MELLLEKLGLSVEHLLCLDRTFQKCSGEYKRISDKLLSPEFKNIYLEISRELYAGGKKAHGNMKLARQMILGDIVEYIFTGRAFYFACKSEDNFKNFIKLIFYIVNQLLIMDSITVNNSLRKCYISNLLECKIPKDILFEKKDDYELAKELLNTDTKLNDKNWKRYDAFIDSILPKTLGCPKELVVFAELIRMKVGIILPLLLVQRLFNERNPIAPPDFLLLKNNKEIYGIEVGYNKEGQSREFSLRTSIPTFAVDLEENMHNRCPVCGEFILYCDRFIENYSNGCNVALKCEQCPDFDNGNCLYSTYYGKYSGYNYNGEKIDEKKCMHYHTKCVKDGYYSYRNRQKNILEEHRQDFYAQFPVIQGIASIMK